MTSHEIAGVEAGAGEVVQPFSQLRHKRVCGRAGDYRSEQLPPLPVFAGIRSSESLVEFLLPNPAGTVRLRWADGSQVAGVDDGSTARISPRQWLRSWLPEGAAAVHELPRFRRHPLVQRVYPPKVLDRLLRLWAHRQELLDALDRLPQVLGHNDAFRRNLFLRSERLLAVDWVFLGPGPVGAELAPLVTASVAFLGVVRDRWRDLEQTVVEAYLRGLQDAGWRGAPDQPRIGFAASSALRYGPGCVAGPAGAAR